VKAQRFYGSAATPLQGIGLNQPFRVAFPLARCGQCRHRIGEDLADDVRRMAVRISNRQTGPERLTAHQPAINTELAPNRFEGVDVACHSIRCRIFRHRRTTMPPKLDDDRPDVLLQICEIWPPLRTARQKAMN
jgi:hypothetical protein